MFTFKQNNLIYISHKQLIDQIYDKTIDISGNTIEKYSINSEIFEINQPFTKRIFSNDGKLPSSKSRKRKLKAEILDPQIQLLFERTSEFLRNCKANGRFFESGKSSDTTLSNEKSYKFYDNFIQKLYFKTQFNGYSNQSDAIVTKINDAFYLIPPNSKFINGNITDSVVLDRLLQEKYNLIIMDPPWWNKCIRRARKSQNSHGYDMLDGVEMAKLPIDQLIETNGLIVIWCTNSETHINSIIEDFLPQWNLQLLAIWFWVKVTKFGDPICTFSDPPKKQPFERLYIATPISNMNSEKYKTIPNERIIISIPSSIHSHKPPIIELLTDLLPDKPKCLELFGRYLLPSVTTVGLEVLKLQNIDLYVKIKR